MAAPKTQPTSASVQGYLAAITDDTRRADCEALAQLMASVTKQPAAMWGTSIVGFGVHRYALAGGKQGEICAVGFSSRKGDISIYGVVGEDADAELLARLGKHKLGKGCLYVGKLADIDTTVLKSLIAKAAKAKLS
ncbi:DUF1801 domain-containing protein [Ideonella sp. DXS29W]|uniref:DUF1801 domain-containing protein n=1 Tax=Ideonella lacteola TaxID=2984193 RepID=A0ABU9BXX0_9BURK